VKALLRRCWSEDEGQDLVEYSLLLVFIALAAVSVLTTVKTNISTMWSSINSALTVATS
jgi:Flp pilus assembly pilin Flp